MAVFRHIEQETCLQFRNVGSVNDDDDENSEETQLAIIAEKKKQEQALEETRALSVTPEDLPQLYNINNTDPQSNIPEPPNNTHEERHSIEPEKEEKVVQQEIQQPETNDLQPEEETVSRPENEAPAIVVGPVDPLNQEMDENNINPYDDENKPKPEIIITIPKSYKREGKSKLETGTSNKNVIKNEIQKSDKILGVNTLDFKSMNLTMKKELLKRGMWCRYL